MELLKLIYLTSKLTWLVKDGYADVTVLVDVWVPDLVDDSQLWRSQRVLFGEDEVAFEEPALVQSVRGTHDQHLKNSNK